MFDRPQRLVRFCIALVTSIGVLQLSATGEAQVGSKDKPAAAPSAANLTPLQVFRSYCVACHNVDGRGAIVRPGMPDIPDFTVAAWHTTKKDPELTKSILDGGKFMPPMKDKLTASDAERMVKFIRAFKDGKQVVALESHEAGKPGAPGSGTSPRGAAVVFREYCMVCHNTDGTGVPAMRAALPPLPDFTKPAFHKEHTDTQLLVSILDGKGTLMPANRGRINDAQARELVAYVRTFGPAGTTGPAAAPASDFQKQMEELQRQLKGLQKDTGPPKSSPPKN